jgi:hypothetical protein
MFTIKYLKVISAQIKNICGETDLYTLNVNDNNFLIHLLIEKGYAELF